MTHPAPALLEKLDLHAERLFARCPQVRRLGAQDGFESVLQVPVTYRQILLHDIRLNHGVGLTEAEEASLLDHAGEYRLLIGLSAGDARLEGSILSGGFHQVLDLEFLCRTFARPEGQWFSATRLPNAQGGWTSLNPEPRLYGLLAAAWPEWRISMGAEGQRLMARKALRPESDSFS